MTSDQENQKTLIDRLRAIKPSPTSPELSEHAYAQAVEDCISIILGEGEPPYPITIGDTGEIALVDHVDNGLETYSWSLDSHGYPRRRTPEDWVYMHTDILGSMEGMLPDHINRDPLDNRRSNLRFVTRGQNVVNSTKAKNDSPTSEYKGVSWDKDRSKWVASICVNDRRMNLGRFSKEDDAALAYNEAALAHFGEAAFLNTVGNSGMVGGLDASTRKDEGSHVCAVQASPNNALDLKPTPDNPCGHSLRIHDVCERCGTLGAAAYLQERQQGEIRLVEDDQVEPVSEWEMARALYADTFQYPIDKAQEWTKLIEGPDWLQSEKYKRMARRCVKALESRGLRITNKPEPVLSKIDPEMPIQELRLHMGEMSAQEVRTSRAAIRWANSVMGGANPKLADARLDASEVQGSVACAMEETPPANQQPVDCPCEGNFKHCARCNPKLDNMMLAHLDGVYKFSARANCDELVTQLIEENKRLAIQLEAELKWRRDNDND